MMTLKTYIMHDEENHLNRVILTEFDLKTLLKILKIRNKKLYFTVFQLQKGGNENVSKQ